MRAEKYPFKMKQKVAPFHLLCLLWKSSVKFPLQNIFLALAVVSALPAALITYHLQSSCDIYLMIPNSPQVKAE